MLYLIKSYGPKGKLEPIYKVGYTNYFEKRLNQYFSHNPFIELISTREGDEELETLIHVCLYSLGYKFQRNGRLNEWFCGDLSKIQYIFHSTKIYLKNFLKKIRTDLYIKNIIDNIELEPYFEDRMRILSEYVKSNPSEIQYLPEKYRKYFESLSIQDMLDCGFRKSNLEEKIKVKRIKNIVFDKNSRISQEVYSVFTENEVYTKKEIKSMLGTIFQKYNYKAKASDIQKYFNVSRVRIKNINTGKYDEGYKLISKIL